MNAITSLFRRLFPSKFRLPPKHEYIPASALPDDLGEMIRAGVVKPWRVAPSGEVWYKSDVGAVTWWRDSFRGQVDA